MDIQTILAFIWNIIKNIFLFSGKISDSIINFSLNQGLPLKAKQITSISLLINLFILILIIFVIKKLEKPIKIILAIIFIWILIGFFF